MFLLYKTYIVIPHDTPHYFSLEVLEQADPPNFLTFFSNFELQFQIFEHSALRYLAQKKRLFLFYKTYIVIPRDTPHYFSLELLEQADPTPIFWTFFSNFELQFQIFEHSALRYLAQKKRLFLLYKTYIVIPRDTPHYFSLEALEQADPPNFLTFFSNFELQIKQ